MSSKINLQTCEYACKSSIFQDNQLILFKPLEYWQICDVIGIRFTRVVKTAFWIKRLRNTDYPTVIVLDFLKCSQIFSPRFHNLIFKGTILRQVGILPQTLVSDQLSKHPFFRFNHIVLYNADGQVLKFGTGRWTVNQSNHNYTYMCGSFSPWFPFR